MVRPNNRVELEIGTKVDISGLEADVARIRQYIDASIEKLSIAKREAHEAFQAAKEQIRELRAAKAEFMNSDELSLRLRTMSDSEMSRYSNDIASAIRDGTQRAYRRFDTIIALCLGTDPESVRDGSTPLLDLIREFIRTRGLPVKLVNIDNDGIPEAFRAKGVRILADETMELCSSAIVFRDPNGKITAKALPTIVSDTDTFST